MKFLISSPINHNQSCVFCHNYTLSKNTLIRTAISKATDFFSFSDRLLFCPCIIQSAAAANLRAVSWIHQKDSLWYGAGIVYTRCSWQNWTWLEKSCQIEFDYKLKDLQTIWTISLSSYIYNTSMMIIGHMSDH